MSTETGTVTWSAPEGTPPPAVMPPVPGEDVIEPITLADLHDLIRETAETLDTLVDHAHALRRESRAAGTVEADLRAIALRDVADRLGAAWAACRTAQTGAQELAAVQP